MNLRSKFVVLAAGILFVASCETDDVVAPPGRGPQVQMNLSPSIISENGGVATLTFTLSESSSSDVSIALNLAGTAELDVDYNIESQNPVVPAGEISLEVTISAIDNDEEDGDKTVVVTISSVSGGFIEGTEQQILTIEDDEGEQGAQVIFNEVLYDPPPGDAGDANGDGVRDAQEDQFLEFYNNSSVEIDLAGWQVYDKTALEDDVPRHVFPDDETSVLPGGMAHVLFADGTPTGDFGGSIVTTTSTGRLNMNNGNDFVTVKDAEGNVVIEFDIFVLDGDPDMSYTRNPDISGEFIMHATIPGITALFSPGTKLDGSPF